MSIASIFAIAAKYTLKEICQQQNDSSEQINIISRGRFVVNVVCVLTVCAIHVFHAQEMAKSLGCRN